MTVATARAGIAAQFSTIVPCTPAMPSTIASYPAAWVAWPTLIRRHTLDGGLYVAVDVVIAVDRNDDQAAQARLDTLLGDGLLGVLDTPVPGCLAAAITDIAEFHTATVGDTPVIACRCRVELYTPATT